MRWRGTIGMLPERKLTASQARQIQSRSREGDALSWCRCIHQERTESKHKPPHLSTLCLMKDVTAASTPGSKYGLPPSVLRSIDSAASGVGAGNQEGPGLPSLASGQAWAVGS